MLAATLKCRRWQEAEQQEQAAGVGFCTSFDHVYVRV